jgi:hypothetical protein
MLKLFDSSKPRITNSYLMLMDYEKILKKVGRIWLLRIMRFKHYLTIKFVL